MNGEKYPLFDAPEDDISPLFTTRLQEQARVGCLRGEFDGNELSTSWLKGNEMLKSPAFGAELRDLVETLRRDGPLKDLEAMCQFCHGIRTRGCPAGRPSTPSASTPAAIGIICGYSLKRKNSICFAIRQTNSGRAGPNQISICFIGGSQKRN